MSSKIIIEENLKEDVIEGLASYMEIELEAAAKLVSDEDIEYILDKMFETESECIYEIANREKE